MFNNSKYVLAIFCCMLFVNTEAAHPVGSHNNFTSCSDGWSDTTMARYKKLASMPDTTKYTTAEVDDIQAFIEHHKTELRTVKANELTILEQSACQTLYELFHTRLNSSSSIVAGHSILAFFSLMTLAHISTHY